ncbi:MAG: S8 family serine peptidase [Oscillospiraceae bacterium]|nr:S8 family serine peptidase [Oscillospiraceae bacterium]
MLNYFATGRVVVAINKDCIIPTNINNPIFEDIEVERVETLFQPQNLSNTSNISALLLIHIKGKDELSVIDAVRKLSENPCVVYSRPDYFMFPHIIPNDPFFYYLWGKEVIKAPMAWDYSTGNNKIVVGVLDSGIEFAHPDLKDNIWSPPYGRGIYDWNFSNDGYSPTDETGHGTHVAGTIGAIGNNSIGITGVCWNVKIAALKIGDNVFSASAAIRAIHYAGINKIPILNCSWGNRAYCPCIKFAIENYDGLLIASAGNDASDNDNFPLYPASFECHNIISVAATAQNNGLAPFSNYGAISVDIAAPGSDIYSTYLLGGYIHKDGTSMAAPHVAGAAALLKSYRPELTALEMKKIILSSVDIQPQLSERVLTAGTLNLSKMIEMSASVA